mgnify:CR=1 FL=1
MGAESCKGSLEDLERVTTSLAALVPWGQYFASSFLALYFVSNFLLSHTSHTKLLSVWVSLSYSCQHCLQSFQTRCGLKQHRSAPSITAPFSLAYSHYCFDAASHLSLAISAHPFPSFIPQSASTMDLPTRMSNLLARDDDRINDFVDLLFNPFAQSASAHSGVLVIPVWLTSTLTD